MSAVLMHLSNILQETTFLRAFVSGLNAGLLDLGMNS